ncbi:MAG: hypothetical protein HZA31_02990 [Opitutae bacterium]|nr:hypothetical protein [Opitutae bacterium]
MMSRLFLLSLFFCLGLFAAPAETVSRSEALAAIATLEKSVLSPTAADAASAITRFAEDSEEVFITIGEETMPWVKDMTGPDAPIRARLTAVYIAGNVKAQLARKRAEDDPYSGWIFLLKAYREVRTAMPRIRIPEIEDLQAKEKAGTLKRDAEKLRKKEECAMRPDIV